MLNFTTDYSKASPGRSRRSRTRTKTFLLGVSLVSLAGLRSAVAAPPATLTAPAAEAAGPAADQQAKLGTDWVRLQLDDDGEPLGMQTAIVRYIPADADPQAPPLAVDLIAAVHVGDAAYYEQLNKRFEQYDALLYELVAPEGTVVEQGRGTSNAHPVGAMQNGMKSMLELEHQLDRVDYTRPNFVHADLSPDQFFEAMDHRGQGFLEMYCQLMGHALAHQSEMAAKGESLDADLLFALFARDRARRLKIILAKQLAEMESLMVGFGGEEGSVLITDRNKMAMKVLKEQMGEGKKVLGVFYGAGHQADMDARLRREFGLRPVSITWVTAWDLAARQ